MSILTEITRLQNAKAALKTALETKGVTVSSDATLDSYATLVNSIPSGGGSSSEVEIKEVNFYDYDGTVVNSYTAIEFLELNDMPTNPNHTEEGLTAQGWNWSFEEAQEYVSKYGRLEIGQMYRTTDGNTKIYIHIDGEPARSCFPYVHLVIGGENYPYYDSNQQEILPTGPGSIEIDWGDESESDIIEIPVDNWYGERFEHEYLSEGDYVINIIPHGNCVKMFLGGHYYLEGDVHNGNLLSDNIDFDGDFHYPEFEVTRYEYNRIKKIFIGDKCKFDSDYGCIGPIADFIVFPPVNDYYGGFGDAGTFGYLQFSRLKHLTIPIGYNNFSGGEGGMAVWNNPFKSLSLPNHMCAHYGCFNDCNRLEILTWPESNGQDETSILTTRWYDELAIKHIVYPDTYTNFKEELRNAHYLETLRLPNTLSSVSNSSLSDISVPYLILPNTVTFISRKLNDWFTIFQGIKRLYILALTPPTISSKTFDNIEYDIYVPASAVEDYKAANIWSTYADKIKAIPE